MSTTLPPPAGASGADIDSPRVRDLKRRVDFDAAVAAERTDEHVQLDVAQFKTPAPVAGWDERRQIDALAEGQTQLNMRFTRGDELVTARLLLFPPQERQGVAEGLIRRANAVTTVELSDTRGPRELGTLALTPSSGSTVYWIYRNVLATVIVHRTQVDKFAVARDMQAQFEAALHRQ